MTTPFHSKYWAHELTLRAATGSIEWLSRSIAGARVNLNPHQVDAALFALRSPLARGAILADEVGLGKTIEAGIVIAQRWAERRRRILLIVPATLRKQWQQELETKFYLPTTVLDSKVASELVEAGNLSPFVMADRLIVCSYHFASAKTQEINRIPWDLIVIDEAHRLRNVFRKSSKLARNIVDAVAQAPELLVTARLTLHTSRPIQRIRPYANSSSSWAATRNWAPASTTSPSTCRFTPRDKVSTLRRAGSR